jgi:hypothetical protein
MKVSGSVYAPAALPLGKQQQQPVPIGKDNGWVLQPFWTLWRKKIFEFKLSP